MLMVCWASKGGARASGNQLLGSAHLPGSNLFLYEGIRQPSDVKQAVEGHAGLCGLPQRCCVYSAGSGCCQVLSGNLWDSELYWTGGDGRWCVCWAKRDPEGRSFHQQGRNSLARSPSPRRSPYKSLSKPSVCWCFRVHMQQ